MKTAAIGASLLQALASVPDPRAARGQRHPIATILALARGHWAIENQLHTVLDVTCGEDASEDASTIRSGSAPKVMAALCSTHLARLRLAGWRTIAAAHRYYAWSSGKVLRLLGLTVT